MYEEDSVCGPEVRMGWDELKKLWYVEKINFGGSYTRIAYYCEYEDAIIRVNGDC